MSPASDRPSIEELRLWKNRLDGYVKDRSDRLVQRAAYTAQTELLQLIVTLADAQLKSDHRIKPP